MDKLFADSKDPDQMSRSAASDLGLHCLPINLLGVSRLQWVNDTLTLWVILSSPREKKRTSRKEREK